MKPERPLVRSALFQNSPSQLSHYQYSKGRLNRNLYQLVNLLLTISFGLPEKTSALCFDIISIVHLLIRCLNYYRSTESS